MKDRENYNEETGNEHNYAVIKEPFDQVWKVGSSAKKWSVNQ